ncbi:MAG: short-subunit dehydrogenase [Flavobacteriales bacterium]|jgi:short-subunit dehydrogenase
MKSVIINSVIMKSVIITGASSGIGMHLAKEYLAKGWKVIACGRSYEKLSLALNTNINTNVNTTAENLTLCCFDLSKRDDVICNASQYKNIDLAILNAGTCEYIDDAKNFDSVLFERVIQTNVIGTAYCLEAILPNINSGGQIAIVSSSATLLPLTRAEAYGASKSALDYLARTLAIDLAPKGIDVSLIRPGFVDTPLTQKNTFSMPGILTAEKASELIVKGIHKRKQEINFPRGFIYILKCLSLLPNALWRRIAIKMIRP